MKMIATVAAVNAKKSTNHTVYGLKRQRIIIGNILGHFR